MDTMERTFQVPSLYSAVEQDIKETLDHRLALLDLSLDSTKEEVEQRVFEQIRNDEKRLYQYIGVSTDAFDFHKIAEKAREITGERQGFFLRKEYAREILTNRPPEFTMEQLGYSSVEEMLEKEDIMDVFSALRFTETDEWMHATFDAAYQKFDADCFEHRNIEIRVLGERYKEVAEKFVAKKHHNVSHLKEFGVIFVNPIAQTDPGKFIRDFALLLHYTYEIVFYSKLFEQYVGDEAFNEHFISLLRGDVPEAVDIKEGQWLVIQRYLWKDNPEDPRLFTPRVNPEALHWHRAEQDVVAAFNFSFWDNTDFIAYPFPGTPDKHLVSFDLEDVAMGFVAYEKGLVDRFFYHQQEALWNNLFARCVGGYDEMEKYIIKNMDKSVIRIEDSI